ncbi:ABC transporter ATP-binding protein [soil metagenome]
MSQTVITVNEVSKLYRLGSKVQVGGSVGDAVMDMVKYPLRNYRKLTSMSKFDKEEDETVLWAVKNVSFEVKQGEVLGLVGKNGAGKSTLLKILSRITLPSAGEININGRVASLLEVGTGFHNELTGRENIYLNGTILGMTRSEITKSFDEIVAFSGIERFIDTPVKRYSSGMMVRLGFSVAAHLEPEILIIDEVLAVGDAEFQKKCLGKMQEVSYGGRTVLFVSHNLLAVQALCTRALLIRSGEKVSDGTPKQIVTEYLNHQGSEARHLAFSMSAAPGNDEVKLLQAEVISMSDGDKIFSRDPIKIRFQYYKLDESPAHIAVTFHLVDEMANLVFVGSSINEQADHKLGKGYFNAECIIPADLMLEGNYNISRLLLIKNGGSIMYEHRDAVSFEIVNKPLYSFGWMGGKEGVVGPKLDWKVSYE